MSPAFQLSHLYTTFSHPTSSANSLGNDSSCFPRHLGIMGQSQIWVEMYSPFKFGGRFLIAQISVRNSWHPEINFYFKKSLRRKYPDHCFSPLAGSPALHLTQCRTVSTHENCLGWQSIWSGFSAHSWFLCLVMPVELGWMPKIPNLPDCPRKEPCYETVLFSVHLYMECIGIY